MAIETRNPTTGRVEASFDELAPAAVDEAIGRAHEAFSSYRLSSIGERAGWMRNAADLLESESEQVSATMTREMGKTLASARAEVAKCAAAARYYAEHAAGLLADENADPVAVGAEAAYARFEPLGVVLAVMPWNFPLWQVMRFAAPGLMAGNVGLLKHASNVPQTARYLGSLFARAGFPAGVFQSLLVSSGAIEPILRDPRVVAATLTGSGPAGRSIAAIAGSELKPTVLELGGSDPFIVLSSADLEAAARTAATARCQNNGQSCIAAKRFIVDSSVAGRFGELFVEAMSALRVGDPMQDSTDVGPLATEQGRTELVELVEDARAKGAKALCGGSVPDGPGWFYPPTVLSGVTEDMAMFSEEVFGPVAALYEVDGPDEALALANATSFGLGSNLWTNDPEERNHLVRDLQAGQVFVNGMVTSYPELPFGGVKGSGYGRELAAEGIRSFTNVKTVWVGNSASPAAAATE